MNKWFVFPVFCLVFLSSQLYASSSDIKVRKLIASGKPPAGVVFEVVSGKDALKWAMPKIKRYVKQLRKKYPGIKIAVVSHGKELFALQKKNQKKYKHVHETTKGLIANDNVSVHVCETYAGMGGATPEDFPKHIQLSTQGPTEIRNYQEFGYKLIIVTNN